MESNYDFNRRGRIWVVWNKNVKSKVIHKSGQMITCSIQVESSDEEFLCSFIYASNFVEERKELWQHMKNQQNAASGCNKPWIIFGDFNETLNLLDHSHSDISPTVSTGM